MNPPIRRGTARRLGLRRWPGGILIFPREVTPEQFAQFKEAFTQAWRTGPTLLLAPGPDIEVSGGEAARRGAQWRIAGRRRRHRAVRARR